MSEPSLDLGSSRNIHIVGIGGAGMSAIATVLSSMGHQVTGSDLKASAATDRLASAGVLVRLGHDAGNVDGAQLVAVSSAISESNPEVQAARARGIEVTSRARVLAAVCSLRRCLAISGTHGKTTTTSMTALIAVEAGMRPSFVIGGDVNEIGSNAVWDGGEWMVVEADESDGTFNELGAEIAVVTNVEPDHLDRYGSFEGLVEAFEAFCAQARRVVAGADDEVSFLLGSRHGADLVGSSERSTHRMENLDITERGVSFDLREGKRRLGRLAVPVLGARIANNAAVAAVAAMRAGASFDSAQRALARFAGVSRRFEPRGEAAGVKFVDDYAHLPSEVREVIAVARRTAPGRLVVVFQPHRYSRIAAIGDEFGDAFEGADELYLTDVFGAGEAPVPGITGKKVADAVERAQRRMAVTYVPRREELTERLIDSLRPGDLCLTLSAGDLTTLPDELIAALRRRDASLVPESRRPEANRR